MLRLIDKNSKIYLYIFFLFFLTSIFNLNIVSFFNNTNITMQLECQKNRVLINNFALISCEAGFFSSLQDTI